MRLRHLLAAGLALGALALGVTPATAAPVATTTDPAHGAAGWLGGQLVDASGKPSPAGDHLNYVGFPGFDGGATADVVFALAAAGVGRDKLAAVMDYYAAHVDSYTAASSNLEVTPGPYGGSVGKAALAAIVAGRDPRAFGGFDLVKVLRDSECTIKSTPPPNDFKTPNCPAVGAARNIYSSVAESFVVLAQARTGTTSTPAVTYLTSLQCKDGGFTSEVTTAGGCTSDVDSTAYAVAALVAVGVHPGAVTAAGRRAVSSAVARGVRWLITRRSTGGYWISQGGPNVDSTGLAGSALAATGRDISLTRSWLRTQQVQVGPTLGPGASRGALKYLGTFQSGSIKATADGLLALSPDTSLATVTSTGARAGLPVLAPAGSVARAALRVGDRQTVTVDGFSRGEPVRLVLNSKPVPLPTARAGANGRVVVTFAVPATLEPGRHTVVLTGATSTLGAPVDFVVTAAPAPKPTPSVTPAAPRAGGGGVGLAATGLDRGAVEALTLLGAGSLLAGAGLMLAARRRT